MTSTSVKVALRVRPLTAKETLANCSECISLIPNEPQVVLGSDRSFTFDYVFAHDVSQAYIYEECVSPLIDKFIEGYNATVLAYGQTGSGKTYSMGTGLDGHIDMETRGIVPRAIHTLFDQLPLTYPSPSSYQVSVSFLELYNEELVDLLNPTRSAPAAASAAPTMDTYGRPGSASSFRSDPPLRIREDEFGNIVWVGVREELCGSPEQLLGTTGSTDMNMVSSRSHAIFSVTLRIQKVSEDAEAEKIQCKFHFVDLAGSERLKKTNAEGTRAKEGISINSGLLALGNVISALGDESRQEQRSHVPYRDSKLTRLLQDSLGGNSQTLMLACVSPADSNFQETLNTLKYANRARNIKNKVVINQQVAANTLEVQQLRTQITRLKLELSALKESGGGGGIPPTRSASFDTLDRSRVADLHKEKARLEFQLQRLEERVLELERQLVALQAERDMLLLEKSGLRPPFAAAATDAAGATAAAEPGAATDVLAPHPLIKEYLLKISDLKKQVFNQETEMAYLKRQLSVLSQVAQYLEPSSKRTYSAREGTGVFRFTVPGTAGTRDQPATPDPHTSPVQRLIEKAREHIQRDLRFLLVTSQTLPALPGSAADGVTLLAPTQDSNQMQVDGPSNVPPDAPPSTSSLSSLVHQTFQTIQSDVAMNQELVQSLEASHQEYTLMHRAYEDKLQQLQASTNVIKQERDQALTRIQGAQTKEKEKELRSKYESKVKQLLNEISQLRRTHFDATKAMSSSKKTDYMLRQMKVSVEALKLEKQRLLKRIKEEADKAKEQAQANEREIQKLKRKEKLATDMAKKFERNFELQKILLKRRTDEVIASHQKLKDATALLSRSAVQKTIAKSGPTPNRPFSAKPPLPPSETDVALELGLASRKHQLYKELEAVVNAQKVNQQMDELIARRKQLTDEKLVLQKEREQVLEVAAPSDPQATLYLDEPIELIEAELLYIEARIKGLQNESVHQENPEHHYDLICQWVRSLGHEEAVSILQNFIDDSIQLQVMSEKQAIEVKNLQEVTSQLRKTMFRMRNTAIGNAVDYEKKIKSMAIRQYLLETQSQEMPQTGGVVDTDVASSLEKHGKTSPTSSIKSSVEDVMGADGKVSPTLAAMRPDARAIYPAPLSAASSASQIARRRPLSAAGQDVFERLAKTYTVSSQAKVRDPHREETDPASATSPFFIPSTLPIPDMPSSNPIWATNPPAPSSALPTWPLTAVQEAEPSTTSATTTVPNTNQDIMMVDQE